MEAISTLLDAAGRPMRRASVRGDDTAHRAASVVSQELGSYRPMSGSADADLLPELDTLRARSRDISRNQGFAAGAMQTHLDNVIGSGLKLSAKPDWRVLGIDAATAREWGRQVEVKYRLWSEDPDFWCDATRHTTVSGILGQAYRSELLNGESLALPLWLPDRGGRFATSVQMIEPDRLSTPWGRVDDAHMRSGVELDDQGAAIAYHIRKQHPGDLHWSAVSSAAAFAWERIPRETPWGRRRVIHTFDRERIGQSRGRPIIAPILETLRMLDHYERTELAAAVVNAMFAAFLESPFDPNMAAAAMGAGGMDAGIGAYQELRTAFHEKNTIRFNGVKLPILLPGEKFTMTTAERPATNFAAFEEAVLRKIAAGLNLTYEQVSRDYSKTNYSSARAAMLESWKFFTTRRNRVGVHIATQIYLLWLEEALDLGEVEMPPGAPSFQEARAAWGRCQWIGPSSGWIDPLKEADAVGRRLDLSITTLEQECAALGQDWEDVLEQRAAEMARMKELGLAPAPAPMAGQRYPTDNEMAVA